MQSSLFSHFKNPAKASAGAGGAATNSSSSAVIAKKRSPKQLGEVFTSTTERHASALTTIVAWNVNGLDIMLKGWAGRLPKIDEYLLSAHDPDVIFISEARLAHASEHRPSEISIKTKEQQLTKKIVDGAFAKEGCFKNYAPFFSLKNDSK
jgi:hypothetical protein